LTVNVAPVLFPVSGFIRAKTNHIKQKILKIIISLFIQIKTDQLNLIIIIIIIIIIILYSFLTSTLTNWTCPQVAN